MLVQYTVNSTWDSLNHTRIKSASHWDQSTTLYITSIMWCMAAVCALYVGRILLELIHHLDNEDGDCDGDWCNSEDGDSTLMVTVGLNADIILYMYDSRSGCHKQQLAEVGLKKPVHQTKIAAAVNSHYTPSSLASLSSSSVNMWRHYQCTHPHHNTQYNKYMYSNCNSDLV